MRKLPFALGLTGVFAIAAQAVAGANVPLCISRVDPQENRTYCEYRVPKTFEIRSRDGSGRISVLHGSIDLRSPPLKGQNPRLCDAFFKEKQKIHGPCRRIFW